MADRLSIQKQAPRLIKKGFGKDLAELEINIVDSEILDGEDIVKSKIHETIGNMNSYEFIGMGGTKIKFKLFFENLTDYDDFYDFISDGKPFVIACNFLPTYVTFKIDGNISKQITYNGAITATICLTDAIDPTTDEDDLLFQSRQFLNTPLSETPGSKKSALDSLKKFAKNTLDFVSNTNTAIGGFTNTVAVYSAAITNVFQGLASASSVISNPIDSVKNSATQVSGGLSGLIAAMQNSVNAAKQLPNDVDDLINLFSQIGDQLNDLFDVGTPNENLQYNTTLLESVSESLINISETPNIFSDKVEELNPSSPTASAEYFLTTLGNRNFETISVMSLTSILLSLYENAENIDKWNSIDLEKLREKTEAIYNFLQNKKINSDLSLELSLARTRFFKIFKIILKNALKTIEVTLPKPTFLCDAVYSVNGNFDYYNETKQLNNIIGSIVEGKIKVVYND